MTQKIGVYNFTIEPHEVDFSGKVTLPFLFKYLFCCAEKHAEQRGFGIRNLNENNYSWVVSHIELEMKDFPRDYETIQIQTWIENVIKIFTSRNFEISDGKGKIFGYARSVWAMIDCDTRRAQDLSKQELDKFIVPEKINPIAKLGKIIPPKEDCIAYNTIVKYSDLDINQHLNSSKYVEKILDLFPLSLYKEKMLERFDIDFDSECLYGDNLTLHRYDISAEESLCVIKKDNEKNVCRSRVVFK